MVDEVIIKLIAVLYIFIHDMPASMYINMTSKMAEIKEFFNSIFCLPMPFKIPKVEKETKVTGAASEANFI